MLHSHSWTRRKSDSDDKRGNIIRFVQILRFHLDDFTDRRGVQVQLNSLPDALCLGEKNTNATQTQSGNVAHRHTATVK